MTIDVHFIDSGVTGELDIVDRLREYAKDWRTRANSAKECHDAIAEIERLRIPAKASKAELWQERAPEGSWYVRTEHDGDIFFGSDKDSAEQCLRALSRVSAQRQPEPIISQHIGWLKQYVEGMTSDNWMDMQLRARFQLKALSESLAFPSTECGSGK